MVSNEQKREFFRAVREGDIATVQRMLNSNNNLINIYDKHGNNESALFIAAENGNRAMVELLIDAGADINIRDEIWTPLSGAASRGHFHVVRLLIEEGANVNVVEEDGESPLYIAAINGHIQIVRLLLDAGAYININDGVWSPLSAAARRNNVQVANLLIERGANINQTDDNGITPLLTAVFGGRYQIVKLLLENGADINIRGNLFGSRPLTPLMMAKTNLRALERSGITDGLAKFEKIIKMIRDIILSEAAKDAILVAEANDMIQDEAFLVFKEIVKKDMKKAGDSDYNVDNQQTNTDLDNYFEKIMKIRRPTSREILEARRARARASTSSSSSTTGGSRSRTKSGKRKSKRSQRRPPNSICTLAQKLGIKLTVKRNNKRVYKSMKVLCAQIKNAVNRQNRKK